MKKALICLFFLSSFGSFAQSQILEEYIAEGISSSLALKQQNLQYEKTVKDIDIAKSNLFPKISLAPTYSLAAGGRRLEFPIGDLLNPVYNTLNKLTQSNSFPNVENVNQLLAPNNFHDTKVSFQYPIFNPDIKNNIALQKEMLGSENAKKMAIEFELKYNIELAYIQYLQATEAIKVYENAKVLLQDLVVLNQKLVNNKVALKDVLLSSEYEVDKINEQLLSAQKNARVAKAYFNFLLNQDFERDIKIDSVFIKESPIVPSLSVLNQSAFDKRPEFEQLESGLRINNRLLTLQEKNAKSPSVYLGGNTGFQGFGYSFTNQAYLVAQVGLQWDIFHGNEKKHKIQQTKISKSILDTKIEEAKNQVSFQVNQNYEEVKNAMDGYLITQKGSIKTEKILEIVNSRYKNGQALFIEVTKAQSDDITAKLSTNISKYNMWLKWAGLKKVSGI